MYNFRLNRIIKIIITLGLLIAIGFCLSDLFGKDSIIFKFYLENVLFSPYNIVGFIIVIIFIVFGIWLGRTKAKILFFIIAFILSLPTIVNILMHIFPETMTRLIKTIKILIIVSLVSVTIVIVLYIIFDFIEANKTKNDCDNSKLSDNIENIKQINKVDEEEKTENAINNNTNIIKNETIIVNDNNQEPINVNKYEYYIKQRRCPYCQSKLVARRNSYDGTYFLGCSKFNKTGCDFTISYKDYYRIRGN